MRLASTVAALAAVTSAAPFANMASTDKRAVSATANSNDDFTTIDASLPSKVIVTKENTLNSTAEPSGSGEPTKVDAAEAQDDVSIPLRLVNNLAGDGVNAYISGTDPDGKVFFLGSDGSLIYPSAGGAVEPVLIADAIAIAMPARGEELRITVPTSFASGRIYFVQGELDFFMVTSDLGTDALVQPTVSNLRDPSVDLSWGFVEMTLTDAGEIWANLSFVDFVGLVLSMTLSSADNTTQQVVGLPGDAVQTLCDALEAQGDSDGLPWGGMCIRGADGSPLRVVSPTDYESIQPGRFDGYWSAYVDDVWQTYSAEPLTVDTQDGGTVTCRVDGDELRCDGDNRGYVKPTAVDIWGCNSGPFAIIDGDNDVHKAVVPRLCAAFVRATLTIDGGNTQPGPEADRYYSTDPTNHYSRIIHENEVDGKGYAFAYDDVNPSGSDDAAGLVNSANPSELVFYIGGQQA
ncbi:hydrolase [Geosmithia morbida]|uniref:Hydrolase n=1 Tax=Geosmithia morbida TaxID=1094350 RepID=A0A9P4YMI3_9HYPO|nr:hydrolase [Geosmithia morbida]KAF4119310.1 hydrolase [Geosmithia morbida]